MRRIQIEGDSRTGNTCLTVTDIKRIVRALEVYELTGETISRKREGSRGISGEYDCVVFGLEVPRQTLYGRIDSSVEKMFDKGLVDEVRRLAGRKLSLTAAKAIGMLKPEPLW